MILFLRNTVFFVCFFAVLTSFGGNFNSMNTMSTKEIQNHHSATEDLSKAAHWLIENGIQFHYISGDDLLRKKLVQEWAVQLWAKPQINDERFIAMFRIKAYGIYYSIQILHRKKIDNEFFEYVLIQTSAKEWALPWEKSWFLVTSATDLKGTRVILKEEEVFFEEYETGKSENFSLPITDLQILYDMLAWMYPDSYPDYLRKKEVYINQNKEYTVRELD
jgi:hypothetical protein